MSTSHIDINFYAIFYSQMQHYPGQLKSRNGSVSCNEALGDRGFAELGYCFHRIAFPYLMEMQPEMRKLHEDIATTTLRKQTCERNQKRTLAVKQVLLSKQTSN